MERIWDRQEYQETCGGGGKDKVLLTAESLIKTGRVLNNHYKGWIEFTVSF